MQIHVGRNNQQLGAFSVKQILDGLASGQFLPTDIAWHEGLADWQPLSSLEALAVTLQPPAPTAAPASPAPKPEFNLPAIERPVTKPSPYRPWLIRLAVAAVLTIIAIPTAYFVKDQSIKRKAVANASTLIAGCKAYAHAHDGRYPPDLVTLVQEKFVADEAALTCPLAKDGKQAGYEYFAAGLKETDPPEKIIVISKAATDGGERVVGRNDGSVNWLAVPKLPQLK